MRVFYTGASCREPFAVTAELATVIDFIRYAASRFAAAGVTFGHGHDNAIDEATHLVLATLHLPPDLPPAYGAGRLTADERARVLVLIKRRVDEGVPVAFLVGEAWFAGMKFKSDPRALVPRSPFAELIEGGFAPWLDSRPVAHALDLCTGSGCIGLAMAEYNPDWRVDIVDISEEALALARENRAMHALEARVEAIHSDLYENLAGRRYELIVSNPPYVSAIEYAALPGEYAHEPPLGLMSGVDGLDLCLRILAGAAEHLTDDGLLMVEVGESEQALVELLPQVPFTWLEFEGGMMGVFVVGRAELVAHAGAVGRVLAARQGSAQGRVARGE
jgi:ribosomal protein L3 glutamine methyltransferase